VHYVVRLGPDLRTRQFLLFRDLEEPDLWLAADGSGGWGEVNGAARAELWGCFDLDLGWTPFATTIAVRALGLRVGESATRSFARIDVESLAADVVTKTYTRVGERRWRVDEPGHGVPGSGVIDVDEQGFVLNHEGRFVRTGS
jgi:hypothetical protein